MKDAEQRYWNEYVQSLEPGQRPVDPSIVTSMAGDERVADQLLQLYLDGVKYAGSSLIKSFEHNGEELPRVGDYWIILNARTEPKCIVQTTRIEMNIFRDVPVAIAIAEGEGDCSLETWRKLHRWFFEPYLDGLGIDDLDMAEVVTEFFEVVYSNDSVSA